MTYDPDQIEARALLALRKAGPGRLPRLVEILEWWAEAPGTRRLLRAQVEDVTITLLGDEDDDTDEGGHGPNGAAS